MATKLSEWVESIHPPVGNGINFRSQWYHEDHISFTPFVANETRLGGGAYDESRKIEVLFPEPVVQLPIPGWVYLWSHDWGTDSGMDSNRMFASEAKMAAAAFVEQLQLFVAEKPHFSNYICDACGGAGASCTECGGSGFKPES